MACPITCEDLTAACDEHGRLGKTASQQGALEMTAHWKCDYSAIPRFRDGTEKGPSDLAIFFYVLKSAPRFLLLTPIVRELLIDCIGRRVVSTMQESTSMNSHH